VGAIGVDALEKLLKAIIAYQGKENMQVHNLIRLSELAEIRDNLNSEQFKFLVFGNRGRTTVTK
jgi:hypothetical protein